MKALKIGVGVFHKTITSFRVVNGADRLLSVDRLVKQSNAM